MVSNPRLPEGSMVVTVDRTRFTVPPGGTLGDLVNQFVAWREYYAGRALAPGEAWPIYRILPYGKVQIGTLGQNGKVDLKGNPTWLPTWTSAKGWTGGDGRTLYAITCQRSGYVTVRPGWEFRHDPMGGTQVTVRIATRDEATRLWQDPLHKGWTVADPTTDD